MIESWHTPEEMVAGSLAANDTSNAVADMKADTYPYLHTRKGGDACMRVCIYRVCVYIHMYR
jgi:hypothetical protein